MIQLDFLQFYSMFSDAQPRSTNFYGRGALIRLVLNFDMLYLNAGLLLRQQTPLQKV